MGNAFGKKDDTKSENPVRLVDGGDLNELPRGTMKEVDVGDNNKVLLVHTENGDLAATSHKCPHYGAPLVKGSLCGDRVLCPWHAAGFSVKTGDIEDAPSLDCLHSFDVTCKNGKVNIKVPEKFPESHKRVPDYAYFDKNDANLHYVVLGGGAAGAVGAETLRQAGYQGKITLVSNEQYLPYDRIKLSKSLSGTPQILRSAEYWKELDVEVQLNKEATEVNAKEKTIAFADGSTMKYSKLLLATGGNARRLQCEGHDLENIFTLRNPGDASSINAASNSAKNVVVVGSSFIGMEAAVYLKGTKKMDNVIVVGMETVPFERVLGADIGAHMQSFHESHGVEFRMKRTVKKFVGTGDGKVKAVVLDNDEELPCDIVVVGAGIIPATSFVKGVTLGRDGSIEVDEHLKCPEVDDLYVAGDIARFKYWHTEQSIRVEHWDVAQQMGRVAAKNMAGQVEAYKTVPFFWTAQWGSNLRYAGNAMSWDSILIKGDMKANKFAAFFCTGSKITAVATMGTDPVAVTVSELIRTKRMLSKDEVERLDDVTTISSFLKK